jgi:hypothetical protein
MADEGAKYNMSMGLKNAISLIPKVQNYVQFAVNEECVKSEECSGYRNFLAKGKPVFHIEYTGATTGNNRLAYKDPAASTRKYCNPLAETVSKFSTIIKPGESLGPAFLYCDGKPGDSTPIRPDSSSRNKSVAPGESGADSEADAETDSESEPKPARGYTPGPARGSGRGSASKPAPEAKPDSAVQSTPNPASAKASGSRFGSSKDTESSGDADSSEAEGPDEVERESDSESSGSDTDGEDSDNDADQPRGKPGRIRVTKPKTTPKASTAPN